jgi:alpha-tubulin suppressor-like RCC1 family protein
MKLKGYLVNLSVALLIALVGISVSASPKRSAKSSSDSEGQDKETFVVVRDGLGSSLCRPANEEERQRIVQGKIKGATRLIYAGAPTRQQLGTSSWVESKSGLVLQSSAGLRIVLHGTAQLEQEQTAKNAFIVAANRWEAIISTPITIVLDVDFGPNFFGTPFPDPDILGQTSTTAMTAAYDQVRNRLIAAASKPEEQQLYAALPTTAVPVNSSSTPVNTIRETKANGRALGLTADISDPNSIPLGQGDAEIGFNSAFTFDFDPSDGIASDQIDFDSVVTHEIGHALGFTSQNGFFSNQLTVWDIFRFDQPITLTDLATKPRALNSGGLQFFFSNHQGTFGSTSLSLSTGGPGGAEGDGRQSSHWKDDSLAGDAYIGIMDPTLRDGLRRTITENDITAVDTFGYSIGLTAPTRPPNDNFANAITLPGNQGQRLDSNVNATRQSGEPAHAGFLGDKSIWYTFTASLSGPMTIDTIGSNFDTTLGVYSGNSLEQLDSRAQNDDISETNHASRVQFNTILGNTYRIAVDGWNGENGNVTLNWNSTGSASDFAIESFNATPNPVSRTGLVTLTLQARNLGPTQALQANLKLTLPAGISFVTCDPFSSCTPPSTNNGGDVFAGFSQVAPNTLLTMSVVARVTAPGGSILTSNAVVTVISPDDPNLLNNTASLSFDVVEPKPFAGAQSIAIGAQTVMALRRGTVWSWGNNSSGQLGDGTHNSRTFPGQVDGLVSVKAISVNNGFVLALKEDGTVWSWGGNFRGTLGIGSLNVFSSSRPLEITGLSSIIAISAGSNHALALRSDGTVWTWGQNFSGQLGIGVNNDFGSYPTPIKVPGLSGIVRVTAGDEVSFAIRNDDKVFVWGKNASGQLGNGSSGSAVTSPVEIPSLQGAMKVASGKDFTVVVKKDNTVWTFGSNAFGRLGQGLADSGIHPTPTQIPNLLASDATAATQAIILELSGNIKTFGSNDAGQLGLGSFDSSAHSSPLQVSSLSSGLSVSANEQSSFAIVSDVTEQTLVKGWGNGSSGIINGANANVSIPSLIPEPDSVASPIISVTSGAVSPGKSVLIVCGTPGSTVHFTTNGQDPTEADPIITSTTPLVINQSQTVKAKAWRTGFTSSAIASATYEVSATPNLIDDARLFVRQQYLDFLGREPDPSGLAFWTDQITSCGADAACIEIKRINVSAAFFLSIEFQQTGYLVERTFKAAFGDSTGLSTLGGDHQLSVPSISRTDLMLDKQIIGENVIVGQPGWEAQLAANKQAFFDVFVGRGTFRSAYPPFAMPAADFVDKLNTNAGRPLSQSERDALVASYQNNNESRVQVLRAIVEHPNFVASESNRAFVLMQYFGYLLRNPKNFPDEDYTGYDFWLTKLNQFNGNFVNAEMVKAFLVSSEYRKRFGNQ